MDEKWFDRFFFVALVLVGVGFAVGIWAVIEVVQWLKTK